jgi:hypothetical protein
MTNKGLLFCVLAVSLAVFSISMAPMTPVPVPGQTMAQSPAHSLTGMSFHTMSAGF